MRNPSIAPLLEHPMHQVVLHCSPEPVWVQGDPTRLNEILVNLLSNAAKFTPDGGRIDVHCERHDPAAGVDVSAGGCAG
jgi:signal transduction histidine kinase